MIFKITIHKNDKSLLQVAETTTTDKNIAEMVRGYYEAQGLLVRIQTES